MSCRFLVERKSTFNSKKPPWRSFPLLHFHPCNCKLFSYFYWIDANFKFGSQVLCCWLWCTLHRGRLFVVVDDFLQDRSLTACVFTTDMWMFCVRMCVLPWSRISFDALFDKRHSPRVTETCHTECECPFYTTWYTLFAFLLLTVSLWQYGDDEKY